MPSHSPTAPVQDACGTQACGSGRGGGRTVRRARATSLLALLSAVAVALSACAPAAAGTSGGAPAVVAGAPVRVQQGTTYYLRFDLAFADFGLVPRDLDVALWVPSGYASSQGEVTSAFGLHDARVAEGWTVELSQVKVEQRTITSTSFATSREEYSLWAVVKVSVPEGIVPGPYRLRATLQARSGKSVPIAATLDVAP